MFSLLSLHTRMQKCRDTDDICITQCQQNSEPPPPQKKWIAETRIGCSLLFLLRGVPVYPKKFDLTAWELTQGGNAARLIYVHEKYKQKYVIIFSTLHLFLQALLRCFAQKCSQMRDNHLIWPSQPAWAVGEGGIHLKSVLVGNRVLKICFICFILFIARMGGRQEMKILYVRCSVTSAGIEI